MTSNEQPAAQGRETVQYLEPQSDGTWRGWEIYDDGTESEKQWFKMDVLPLGYVPVQS